MIAVVGGTYREIDYDDISGEIFGSGFRCAKFLLENNCAVNFFTSANKEIVGFLEQCAKVYPGLNLSYVENNELITFKYCFALDDPNILPSILKINRTADFKVSEQNIICYGMLESDYEIVGDKVVYDPQTTLNPVEFSKLGRASALIYIVNRNESEAMSGSPLLDEVIEYFFTKEKAIALVIKDGPKGATLYTKNKYFKVPAYITENVNKIGSGDIFTASFGYYWMQKNLSLEDCALFASRSTALYCNIKAFIDTSALKTFHFKEFHAENLSTKQIYLAAPFFSISDLILIDKIRDAFLVFGVKVFSPFHDIGFGVDDSIVTKDIEGINRSDVVFCVLDNLDSGTLIEVGYSLAKEKKVIGYHRTCTDSNLLMLKLGDIKVFQNLTTAIYQAIWNL